MYGKSLLEIQFELISKIPKQGSLLILGGGDGKILPLIFKTSPQLQLIYVEASSVMIKLAIKNSPREQNILFVHSDNFDYPTEHIDYVYAGFIFDVFNEQKISYIINKIESSHTNNLTWYVVDFDLSQNTNLLGIRRIQIKLSILFFKITTEHSIKTLPKVFQIFRQNGYNTLKYNTLKRGFLRSEVFKL
ncbi:MAG: hypothetical protein COA58_02335 [Bacteroidetes bacterium]|nr:MAG: hypothetical protein COA58_02335 [Bacteroidota bacterium]